MRRSAHHKAGRLHPSRRSAGPTCRDRGAAHPARGHNAPAAARYRTAPAVRSAGRPAHCRNPARPRSRADRSPAVRRGRQQAGPSPCPASRASPIWCRTRPSSAWSAARYRRAARSSTAARCHADRRVAAGSPAGPPAWSPPPRSDADARPARPHRAGSGTARRTAADRRCRSSHSRRRPAPTSAAAAWHHYARRPAPPASAPPARRRPGGRRSCAPRCRGRCRWRTDRR